MRLLRCNTCRTMEQLPDAPPGIDPNRIEEGQDPVLEALVARHPQHLGQLFSIADDDWKNDERRTKILEEMGAGHTGFDPEAYALRNTFLDDAMACFKAHLRPAEGCPDYKSDSKKLAHPTREGRKLQMLNEKAPVPYLCDWCPAKSYVQTKVFDNSGIRN